MSPNPLLECAMIAEATLCVALLFVCWRMHLLGRFKFIAIMMGFWALELSVSIATLFFRRKIGIPLPLSYHLYVYSYWVNSAATQILTVCLIYQVFRQSMTPFRGLHRLGTMIFRWVCGVCVLVTFAVTLVPMHTTGGYLTAMLQLGQSISILTICLLLFVCFSAHYLGMTYRTRLFGVSLGLGVQGLANLLVYALTSTHAVQSLYSSTNLIPAFGGIVTIAIWGTYFLMPEPVQKMVLLPTTSPYFHWNQVSEALGTNPGMVAIAGFTPDMLSPAERKMLGATAKRLHGDAGMMASNGDMSVANHAIAMPR